MLEAKVVERVGRPDLDSGGCAYPQRFEQRSRSRNRKGNFREDLYYRLKVLHIRMPSLREIREDIPLLANHFLAECAHDSGKQVEFAPEVVRRLTEAEWPGNVRQLQNEIKRLVACAHKRVIGLDDLAEGLPETRNYDPRPPIKGPVSLRTAVEDLERRMIAEMLQRTGNNQQKAAKSLGLSRQGLINKMKRYRLRSADASA